MIIIMGLRLQIKRRPADVDDSNLCILYHKVDMLSMKQRNTFHGNRMAR